MIFTVILVFNIWMSDNRGFCGLYNCQITYYNFIVLVNIYYIL